ncbi:hypothetical protein ACTL6U_02075 [Rhodovibrionaceae bacterium A322]
MRLVVTASLIGFGFMIAAVLLSPRVNAYSFPNYDRDTYCSLQAGVRSDAKQVIEGCMVAEKRARQATLYRYAQSENLAYCEEQADRVGGSYRILQLCLERQDKEHPPLKLN